MSTSDQPSHDPASRASLHASISKDLHLSFSAQYILGTLTTARAVIQSQLILAQRLIIRLFKFELGTHEDGTIEEIKRETSEKYDAHLEILNKVITLCNDHLERMETWRKSFDFVLQKVRLNAGTFIDDDGEVVDTVT
jgi:hypothetical protein